MHLNGELVDARGARVSVFDRGFLFGDGVYEGLRVTGGHVIALDRHARRMAAGMEEIFLGGFDAGRELGALTAGLLEANGLEDAFVYWQVTRGTPGEGEAPRERVPGGAMRPTVFGYAAALPSVWSIEGPSERRVALRPDTRWARGHIKGISLLGSVVAALEAREASCDDAILVRDGLVTEGTASNVVLSVGGRLVTPSLESAPMLAGVTRGLLLEAEPGIEERPVRVEELGEAEEVMLVGTQTMVSSVVRIDGVEVGSGGGVGPGARRLLRSLLGAIERDVHSAHGRRRAGGAGDQRGEHEHASGRVRGG